MTIYAHPPLVEVLWHDTSGHHKWFDSEGWGDIEPIVVRTMGYMVQKNKIMVRLCMSVRDDSIIGDLMVIPRGCVVHIKKLGDFMDGENAK